MAERIYARLDLIGRKAIIKSQEFYAFWRTLETYRKTMDTATTIVLSPKSELYRYLAGP